MVAHTSNTSIGRLRQEDHKFKISLGYIDSLSSIPIPPFLLHKKRGLSYLILTDP